MNKIKAIDDAAKIAPKTASYILQADNPRSLSALRSSLGRNQENCVVTHDLPIIDGMAVEIPRDSMDFLKQLKGMGIKVTPNRKVYIPEPPKMQESENVEPPRLHVANRSLNLDKLRAKGITGKNVTVAVIDSGIAPHADLEGRIVGFFDLVNQQSEAYDDNKHGTHVSGIIAGNGKNCKGVYMGAAPEANLVGIKVLDAEGKSDTATIIEGIQTAIEHKDEFDIKVINISLGSAPETRYEDDPKVQAVEKAIEAGITVVCAAGNSGPKVQPIGSPAVAPNVITVGAVDDKRTPERNDDQIAYFTSRGPTKFNQLPKPDIVAPGVKIASTSLDMVKYIALSGTSMAAPMVTGSVALLYQVKPDLNPREAKELLMETAIPLPAPKLTPIAQGKGMIDPEKAVEKLLNHKKNNKKINNNN